MLTWLKTLRTASQETRDQRRREAAQRQAAAVEAAQAQQRRDQARREAQEHKARVYRLADQNGHLLRELFTLVGDDGGFGHCARIRAIGEELNRLGGMDLMQCGYYGVRNAGRHFSQDIWDGVGPWRC